MLYMKSIMGLIYENVDRFLVLYKELDILLMNIWTFVHNKI